MFITLLYWLFSDLALFLTAFVGTILMIVLTWRYGRMQISRNQFLIFWLIFVFSCGLACFHIHRLGYEIDREHVRIILELARVSARALTYDAVSADPVELNGEGPGFQKIQELLRSWGETNDEIDSVYLLRHDGERIDMPCFFSKNVSRPSTELADRYFNVAKNNELPGFVDNPIGRGTSYGKVVHPDGKIRRFIAEPLFAPNTDVETVLCFEFHDWRELIVQTRMWPHIFFFSFLVFVMTTQIFFIRRRLFSSKLRDTRVVSYEKAIESLVEVQGRAKDDADFKNEIFRLINDSVKRPIVAILESSHTQPRLEDKGGVPVDSSLVDRILRDKRELQDVIHDLQMFVDLEWNRLTIERTLFSPERMFNDFRNSCQVRLRQFGNRTFLLELPKLVPRQIIGDEMKIRCVFERFFDWILSDVSERHVKFICSLTETELCLTAVDSENKRSIRSIVESDILTDSRWLSGSSESSEKTYDFGMHVASRLSRFLGGTIAVQSRPGRGKKYTITIPIELPGKTPVECFESYT